MNSAPTAEELPPLEESIVKSVEELSRHMKVQLAPIMAVRYMVANNVMCGLEQRESQLLAALRENREKDARIAELEKHGNLQFEEVHNALDRAEAAEAKLRAVSDALDTFTARIRAILEGK